MKRLIHALQSACAGLVLLPAVSLPAFSEAAPQATGPIRLPLTFAQSIPVTTISVAGRTAPAIVDISGGDADGALTLSKELIAAAQGISLGTAVATDAFGHDFTRPRFSIPVVTIGGHVFRDVRVVQAVARAGEEGPGPPNAIGKYLLSRYFVVVDYAGASVTLWPSDMKNPPGQDCGSTRIPMERTAQDKLAVSTLDVPAGRLRLLWDAGSYSALPETLVEQLRLATATRGPGSPKFYRATTLSAAGRDLGSLDFVVLPLQLPGDFAGILGWNFFTRHVVCLDYRRREIRVN